MNHISNQSAAFNHICNCLMVPLPVSLCFTCSC
uniref:Uncharacterized protein n=1 Tax=Anguilla anguilla TaxID=7936 RepID=A0A0E9U8W2_ANGAN